MTLRRHDAMLVRRGRLNLQNTSAGARQLFWSAANLSCLPPLWSCLNKNESGGDPGGTKSFRRCRSSAKLHCVYHGPALMVARPRYHTSELGNPHLDTHYIPLHLLFFTVRCYQLLVESVAEVALPCWVIFNCQEKWLRSAAAGGTCAAQWLLWE